MQTTYQESNDTDTFVGMSDMLFMVCLALVMVIFLLMIAQGVGSATAQALQDQLEDSISKAAKDAVENQKREQEFDKREKKSQRELQDNRRKLDENQRKMGKQQAELDKVRDAQAVTVSIAIDCTGSMQQAIADLNRTIVLVAELMPKALRTFRLGLVLYRDGKTVEFPIREIKRQEDDGGNSIKALLEYTGRIQAKGGTANLDDALRGCMKQLNQEPAGPRQCLMLLGDVGPGELPRHTAAYTSQLTTEIRAWANARGTDRRVLALFAGNKSGRDQDFYQQIGSVNPKSVFGTSTAEMFRLIFEAAFTKD